MTDEAKPKTIIPDGIPIIDFKVHEDEEKITLTLEGGEQIIFVLEGESSDDLTSDPDRGTILDAEIVPTEATKDDVPS